MSKFEGPFSHHKDGIYYIQVIPSIGKLKLSFNPSKALEKPKWQKLQVLEQKKI